MRILINSTSLEIGLCAYFSNVHYHFCYGIIFWGNSPNCKLTFKVQKRIIGTLTHSTLITSYRPLFKLLNIMPLPCMQSFETIMFVKQDMLSGGQIFQTNSNLHKHNTRLKNTTSTFLQHLLIYHLIAQTVLALDCQNPSNKLLKWIYLKRNWRKICYITPSKVSMNTQTKT